MKNNFAILTLVALASLASNALAADRKLMLPIAAAVEENGARAQLDENIGLYFSGQPVPKILEQLGSDKTSQKTNAFGKSDVTACNWVFMSALVRLQKKAVELGANAVVNIVSNYKNVEVSSSTQFECHAGALMAGVALKGDFVKVVKN